MPITGLNHINFRAHPPLLDALRDFYCDVVGLIEGPRPPFPRPGYWLYAGGEPIMHLYEAEVGEIREPEADGVFDHVAFSCSDPAATEARLKALGVPYRSTGIPGTHLRQIFLQDPAGNRVELQFSQA